LNQRSFDRSLAHELTNCSNRARWQKFQR
jgi:hypothetical protein